MAAPNIVGSPGSDQLRGPEAPEPATSSSDGVRAARIAELAARLAAIEARDQSPAHPNAAVAGQERILAPETTSKSRSAAPIGSSGSVGRDRGEPGGHPEDAPGDPETVAKAICLRLLTAAARPRAALESALRQRGIPDQVATTVLNRFVEVGLINDQAYAEAFVTVKHRERALGATALRTELRRKGVDDAIVAAAVQAVDQDAERERAIALVSRRVDAAMSNGVPTARRRLIGLLARRGYSADLARQVVEDALAEYGAEQENGWSD